MSPAKLVALASLLPFAALAQSPGAAVDAARQAAKKQQAGIERREKLVDQGAPQEAGEPPAGEPPPEEPSNAVDLTKAAEKLEGAAPEVEAPGAGPGAAQPPDTYTVKPGDTLWDLSGRFLNNPWYWPKVWSYNPEITNPHWIYPGNVVRFLPSAEEAPARVEPVGPVAAEEEQPSAPRELEDLSKGNIQRPEQLGEDDAVAVVGPYKVGQVPSRPPPIRRDSFMTRMQLEEAGRIVGAFEEKLILTHLDKIYARFKDPASVRAGQIYAIYRSEGPIYHPKTGEAVGYKTLILGQAKVTRLDDKAVTLLITAAYDTIDRGDYLGPWSEKLVKRIQARPNQASVDGFIVAVTPSVLTNLGEANVVYLDKGQADGVEEGNTFKVLRSGDRSKEPPDRPIYDSSLPLEEVGTLVIFDVKERNSSAYVARSLFELYVGDRVEMRPARAAGSGGS